MDELEFDVKKEEILSRLDYAISCLKDMEKYHTTMNPKCWLNMQQLLKDIEKLVQEY